MSTAELKKIAFARPWITDDEKDAVLEVLKSDVLTHGPQGHHFEQEFAQFMGGEAYCISLSSGMAALHLAYFQMGLKSGDEVIVPAQTHIATVHAVEVMGGRPIFVDADPATGNMDISQIEARITPKTKAIGLVHFLGIPCEMDAIMKIAEKHNLKVVEDCALAVGTRFRKQHVGLIGEAGCFSFYPVKHITTGDGGMFVTRHKEIADRVMKARAFGVDRSFSERKIPGLYDVPTLGLNYRMSDINASIGRQQIKKLPEISKRRRANFVQLKKALSGLQNTRILDGSEDHATNSHYCLSLVLLGALGRRRDEIVKQINAAGVGTSVYYPQPVPRMTYYKSKYGYDANQYPEAERISDCSIALPVGPHLSADDLTTIAQTVIEILNKENKQ